MMITHLGRKELRMEEKCINCRHCKTLYFPPTVNEEARHEHCCTVFLDENSVMYLGNDTSGLCECFSEKEIIKENENDGE